MPFNALKSSSLIIAAACGVNATPNTQAAAAAYRIWEGIFMGKFLGKFPGFLVSAVLRERLRDYRRLRRGDIGPGAHVQHEGFPLGRRRRAGIAFGMAAVALA